jgi:hypothetical protein
MPSCYQHLQYVPVLQPSLVLATRALLLQWIAEVQQHGINALQVGERALSCERGGLFQRVGEH